MKYPLRDPGSAPVRVKALGQCGLEALAESLGEPAYRGRQLYRWLFGRGAGSFDEMTDLPVRFRRVLADVATLDTITLDRLETAHDETAKGLFRLPSGRHVETVLIPELGKRAGRLTVCVSSQVGCAMACAFCATGRMGFMQNLTAGEIVDQVRMMNDLAVKRYGRTVTNVVFMGMGEPLLNYDNLLLGLAALSFEGGLAIAPRRITVSTVGLARRIRQLARDRPRYNLAVSLHAPTEAKRSAIIPINRRVATGLAALTDALRYYTHTTGRRVTFEYCLFHGVNDTLDDARALARIALGAPGKVNLIMYNAVEGLGFERTTDVRLQEFIRILVGRGVRVTVRKSRGEDIDAACGQLANRSARATEPG